jgi:hypothetical protein
MMMAGCTITTTSSSDQQLVIPAIIFPYNFNFSINSYYPLLKILMIGRSSGRGHAPQGVVGLVVVMECQDL